MPESLRRFTLEPMLEALTPPGIFGLYAVLTLVSLVFVALVVPASARSQEGTQCSADLLKLHEYSSYILGFWNTCNHLLRNRTQS